MSKRDYYEVLGVPKSASADEIKKALEHDLSKETEFDYKNLAIGDMVAHFAKFISSLWQIHAFGKGNTRTTAVFASNISVRWDLKPTMIYLPITHGISAMHWSGQIIGITGKISPLIPSIWSDFSAIF